MFAGVLQDHGARVHVHDGGASDTWGVQIQIYLTARHGSGLGGSMLNSHCCVSENVGMSDSRLVSTLLAAGAGRV